MPPASAISWLFSTQGVKTDSVGGCIGGVGMNGEKELGSGAGCVPGV